MLTYISCQLLKWLSWIEFSISSWHLMLHIVMSNVSMDWHKYPKSRKSIRIQQPATLYIIICHTFPGLGGKTLDIARFASSIFFCAKCFNCDANSFIVIPAGLVHAEARQSDLPHTSTGKSTWRLAEGCFGPTSLAQTGGLPGYWPGPAYPPIWWWPSKSVTLTARRVSTAQQPPFKSLAVPPLGLSVLPNPRLQGQPWASTYTRVIIANFTSKLILSKGCNVEYYN